MRVLVIDDDSHVAKLMASLLKGEGYIAQLCADGAIAAQRLRAAAEPMVVLLDRSLPALSGEDLLSQLPADSLLARHRYIIVSGDYSPLAPAAQLAVVQFHIPVLPKPFHLDDFFALVAQAEQDLRLAVIAPHHDRAENDAAP